jgi:hypothetical protein
MKHIFFFIVQNAGYYIEIEITVWQKIPTAPYKPVLFLPAVQ